MVAGVVVPLLTSVRLLSMRNEPSTETRFARSAERIKLFDLITTSAPPCWPLARIDPPFEMIANGLEMLITPPVPGPDDVVIRLGVAALSSRRKLPDGKIRKMLPAGPFREFVVIAPP